MSKLKKPSTEQESDQKADQSRWMEGTCKVEPAQSKMTTMFGDLRNVPGLQGLSTHLQGSLLGLP